eukprot:jgi/Botrbrau1/17983/Bobra.0457s0002.2
MEDDEFDWGEADDIEEQVDYDYDDWENYHTAETEAELAGPLGPTPAPEAEVNGLSETAVELKTEVGTGVEAPVVSLQEPSRHIKKEQESQIKGPDHEVVTQINKPVKEDVPAPSAQPLKQQNQLTGNRAAQVALVSNGRVSEKTVSSSKVRVPIPPPSLPTRSANEAKAGKLASEKTSAGTRGTQQVPDTKSSTMAKMPKGDVATKSTGDARGIKRELDVQPQDSNRHTKRRPDRESPAGQKQAPALPQGPGVTGRARALPQKAGLPMPPGFTNMAPVPGPRPPPGPMPQPRGGPQGPSSRPAALRRAPTMEEQRQQLPGSSFLQHRPVLVPPGLLGGGVAGISRGTPGPGRRFMDPMQAIVGHQNVRPGHPPVALPQQLNTLPNRPRPFQPDSNVPPELHQEAQRRIQLQQQQQQQLAQGPMTLPMPSASAGLGPGRHPLPPHRQTQHLQNLQSSPHRPIRQGGPMPEVQNGLTGNVVRGPQQGSLGPGPGGVGDLGRGAPAGPGFQAGPGNTQGGVNRIGGLPLPGMQGDWQPRPQDMRGPFPPQDAWRLHQGPAFGLAQRNPPSPGPRLPGGPPPALAGDMGFGASEEPPFRVQGLPELGQRRASQLNHPLYRGVGRGASGPIPTPGDFKQVQMPGEFKHIQMPGEFKQMQRLGDFKQGQMPCRAPGIQEDIGARLRTLPQGLVKPPEQKTESNAIKLEEIRKEQKMLEIKLQHHENVLLQREKEEKLKKLRLQQEAKKAQLLAARVQVVQAAAGESSTLQEMKDQIMKLQEMVSKMSEGTQGVAHTPTPTVQEVQQTAPSAPSVQVASRSADGAHHPIAPEPKKAYQPEAVVARPRPHDEAAAVTKDIRFPVEPVTEVAMVVTSEMAREKEKKRKSKKRNKSSERIDNDASPPTARTVEWEPNTDLRNLLTRKRKEEGRADSESEHRGRSSRSRPKFEEVYRPKGAR